MRRLAVLSLIAALTPTLAQQATTTGNLPGFTPASSATERAWESKFLAMPDSKHIIDNMHVLAAHPHHVGSAAQKANADWLVAHYKSWGWDAKIEQFDVLYPTPKTRLLELTGPHPYKARLEEPVVPEDPYTADPSPRIPPYNNLRRRW